jgi:asparagine synthase (glutamine-hydrolysing)
VAPPGFLGSVLAAGLEQGRLPRPAPGPALARAAAFDQLYLRWDLLPKLDVAAMAAGIEGRCPYLDPEVRAAAADPRTARPGKAALRRAFAALLPRAVRRAGKRGFALPLDRWLRQGTGLLDLILDRRSLERPHLRRDGVRAAVDRHRRVRSRLGHALYLLAAMEVHLRCVEEETCASAGS